MEIKKSQFDQRPSLVELEGAVIRINFDIEASSVPVNNMNADDEEEPQTREVFLAHVVRVNHPLSLESIKAAVMELGFDEYKAEAVAAEALLSLAQDGQHVGDPVALAKQLMIARINIYDNSEAVNQFTLSGTPMWLDDATRTKLAKRFDTDEKDEKTETKLIYNGVPFDLPIETAKGMLHQLESYARDCFDQTNAHIAAVSELDDVEDILAYDYTDGYPNNPEF